MADDFRRAMTELWIQDHAPDRIYSSRPDMPLLSSRSSPPSDAGSSESVPPAMLLRYGDGRPDEQIPRSKDVGHGVVGKTGAKRHRSHGNDSEDWDGEPPRRVRHPKQQIVVPPQPNYVVAQSPQQPPIVVSSYHQRSRPTIIIQETTDRHQPPIIIQEDTRHRPHTPIIIQEDTRHRPHTPVIIQEDKRRRPHTPIIIEPERASQQPIGLYPHHSYRPEQPPIILSPRSHSYPSEPPITHNTPITGTHSSAGHSYPSNADPPIILNSQAPSSHRSNRAGKELPMSDVLINPNISTSRSKSKSSSKDHEPETSLAPNPRNHPSAPYPLSDRHPSSVAASNSKSSRKTSSRNDVGIQNTSHDRGVPILALSTSQSSWTSSSKSSSGGTIKKTDHTFLSQRESKLGEGRVG
ncbi:hypothetical protein BDZ97DRAFT_1867497, partial [Flammula alnicola]